MKKLEQSQINGRLLPAGGTAFQYPTTNDAGALVWKDVPKELPDISTSTQANVLTALSGGGLAYLGNVVILLERGATVPAGTPIGAIITQKGASS